MAPLPYANAESCSWPAPPNDIALGNGEIHLWCVAPRHFSDALPYLRSLISVAERDRAARFQFSEHHVSYVIRHALLRLVLSRYLKQAPSEIEFSYGHHGKPALKNGELAHYFNDSHAAELALFAIARQPVGVDIECVRPISEFESIASRYLSAREVASMCALSTEQRMKAFYSCWTGKEAHLKATGEGIGENLQKVEVRLDADLRAASLIVEDADRPSGWQLRGFSPAPGFLGAVCTQADLSAISFWNIHPSWLDQSR